MSLDRWFKEKWVDVKRARNVAEVRMKKADLTLLVDHQKELVARLQRLQVK